MNFVDAFLMATAAAYLGCLISTCLGKPPMYNIREDLQTVFYGFACIIFILSSIVVFSQYVYACLGVVYGIASVSSFIGWPQTWMAYWREYPEQGSDAAQIGMAFWDLTIAVLFFMKVTF